MKISNQILENNQAILDIEAEPQEIEKSREMAYHHLIKQINIPGFRKGKAPRSILEHYIGKEEIQKEALEHLIPQLCNQAAEEQKIDVIAQPKVEVLQIDPVLLKVTYPLRPQVELGDYQSIRLTPQTIEVTEEEINSVVEQLRERQAVWIPVERPVAFGDLVTVDLEEKKAEDGSINKYPGQQFPVIQDSKLPLPGFAEHLSGMVMNEEKEFTLSFPDDYQIKEIAGKEYNFKVRLIELKEKQLPELNDEFAKSVGQGVETIDALHSSITNNLKNIADERAKREFEQKVIEALVDLSKVEFPPVLVEQEIDRFLDERDRLFAKQGGLESYLKTLNKTEEQIRDEFRPRATKELVQTLVLSKVVEKEKIEVSANEIDTEIDKTLKDAGEGNKELKNMFGTEQGRRWIEERLIIQKAVQRLVDIASSSADEEALERSQDAKST